MFGTNRALRCCTFSIALFTMQALAQAGDVFVDAGASGDGSGSSWANAFVQLQDGLAAAQSGDTIFVAGGVYLPDRSAGQPTGTGDRFASFRIEQSLAVLGGFAGSADPGDPDKHNPFEFTTVLSGDLAQDDGGLFDPNTVNPSKPEFQDNSAHVVIVTTSPGSAGGFVSVSLRDLVIQGGFARQDTAPPGSPDPMTGAGLLCYEANTATGLLVTLDKCTLQGNFAMESGGGIASKGNGIVMRSCRVVGNASRYGAGYVGLAQETDDSHAHLTAVRTLWAFNHVRLVSSGTPAGGGLALDRAIVDARNCVFFSNSASTGNTTGRGGAIYVRGGSVLRAHNNTFRENRNFSGTAGATLYCEDVIGGLEFANNICWGAVPVSAHMRYPVDQSSIRRFGSNDIEDKGNNLPDDPAPGFDIDADPQFFNALGRLSSSSPCIDAGRNQGVPEDAGAIMELDYEGTTRILDHAVSGATGFGGPPGWDSESTQGQRPIVDIGAFEFVLDCNGNGIPDDEDILSGSSYDCDGNGVPDECQPDCNSDGVPDVCDFDCQPNGISDICEILGGAPDCNGNGIPDECEPDCDSDGTPDDCEPDCDGDGTPDDCEPADCDGDGTPDVCEPDCNNDGVPDDCEEDCDGDGTPDVCEPDCNKDGVPDDCEEDCDGDGTPDVCEPDCNKDGIPDDCEPDCDGDGTPDVCEPDCNKDGVPDDCEPDCDEDGTPDVCEPDCDNDGVPDDCEEDCDGDGTPDDCEVPGGDCNGDGVPDSCQMVDCNGNGVLDVCDIDSGFSEDCDSSGIPDECQLEDGGCLVDCNSNGTLDVCELCDGAQGSGCGGPCCPDCDCNGIPDACEPHEDCNGNGIPDVCDIDTGFSGDCNENGVPDECEGFPDCNGNRVPDFCDIEDGTSEDTNGDGIPDECQHECTEGPGTTRFESLTPSDTFSVVTSVHTPDHEEGFAFVTAVNKDGSPIAYDYLIGTIVILDGMEGFDYQVNAASFRSPLAKGSVTDLDFDCHLDLNGLEYEMAPGELLVPRFMGQDLGAGLTSATVVLVGLSGGTEFDTIVDFLLYNDNEEAFSTQYTFRSWAKVRLVDISAAFSQEFLQFFTAHDPAEVFGDPTAEAGWFRMQGLVANSSAASINDPAIYGFLIEGGGGTGAASLPFESGSRAGHLLPGAVLGDNEEVRGQNPGDPAVNLHRRSKGSLLLYPEFDNHEGVLSILTVTNTGKETVTARFVYYGP